MRSLPILFALVTIGCSSPGSPPTHCRARGTAGSSGVDLWSYDTANAVAPDASATRVECLQVNSEDAVYVAFGGPTIERTAIEATLPYWPVGTRVSIQQAAQLHVDIGGMACDAWDPLASTFLWEQGAPTWRVSVAAVCSATGENFAGILAGDLFE